jgi:hypothetical protein
VLQVRANVHKGLKTIRKAHNRGVTTKRLLCAFAAPAATAADEHSPTTDPTDSMAAGEGVGTDGQPSGGGGGGQTEAGAPEAADSGAGVLPATAAGPTSSASGSSQARAEPAIPTPRRLTRGTSHDQGSLGEMSLARRASRRVASLLGM